MQLRYINVTGYIYLFLNISNITQILPLNTSEGMSFGPVSGSQPATRQHGCVNYNNQYAYTFGGIGVTDPLVHRCAIDYSSCTSFASTEISARDPYAIAVDDLIFVLGGYVSESVQSWESVIRVWDTVSNTWIGNQDPYNPTIKTGRSLSMSNGFFPRPRGFTTAAYFKSVNKLILIGSNEQSIGGQIEVFSFGYRQTSSPSVMPTQAPTLTPTVPPSNAPSLTPTISTSNPSRKPTEVGETRPPSADPSISPTNNPTDTPTTSPTESPSVNPTLNPTLSPSINPTENPTINPTLYPTNNPLRNATLYPTLLPSITPTISPTISPIVMYIQYPSWKHFILQKCILTI